MPEGDTVHLSASRLRKALAGKTLTASDFRIPSLATFDVSGRQVESVEAVGKHMLIRISPDLTLHTHFEMDGSWHLYRPGSRWKGPDHQVRVVLRTEPWIAVGFRLPVVEVVPTESEKDLVGHLGPDPLRDDWDPGLAERNLRADPDRPLGAALLDQRVIAGPGNVYRSEICFLSGLHPGMPVGRAPSVRGIVDLVARTMSANRNTGNQITTGDSRPGRGRYVYDRWNRPCLRCGTAIARRMMDGPGGLRAVFWCPRCQPEQGEG